MNADDNDVNETPTKWLTMGWKSDSSAGVNVVAGRPAAAGRAPGARRPVLRQIPSGSSLMLMEF